MENTDNFTLACPIPIAQYPQILLAHGGGGKLMHQLIDKMLAPTFGTTDIQHDAATFELPRGRVAFTTDSYVVRPLFFPGGDIGSIAVCGTVNDLAMAGARPLYLSAGFILEEGLAIESLWRVVQSMQATAQKAGVRIITGDTKVVDRGKGDGIFINTAGVGIIEHDLSISPKAVQPSDVLLLNGDIGRHGIAIMALREGLAFTHTIDSDVAPVADLVGQLLAAGIEIHCLRDLTRGGLATTLNEIAAASRKDIQIDESLIPVEEQVQGACEILGLDPLYVACEGRFVAFVPPQDADRALAIMQQHPLGVGACQIGSVTAETTGLVSLRSKIGVARIIDMLTGEQLPRIC
ncbi:MAG TPA: hydrogenase expression/formation protein HypE [Oscillatoriaceae cyanobacterium M33_DOE_052]|uniref:Hydrogenase expression/formation protein HypE n=1 Tax=Planktothricoides sp. SpSt-374 TaxID=2282167 RepID=A0A7C3ZR56_9CYAN|nr:hydrogenase expression/formation protein HypE [Oscillatoriaceae cyanobacterium M33_DOE_052]